jgi:hypothetical protein
LGATDDDLAGLYVLVLIPLHSATLNLLAHDDIGGINYQHIQKCLSSDDLATVERCSSQSKSIVLLQHYDHVLFNGLD